MCCTLVMGRQLAEEVDEDCGGHVYFGRSAAGCSLRAKSNRSSAVVIDQSSRLAGQRALFQPMQSIRRRICPNLPVHNAFDKVISTPRDKISCPPARCNLLSPLPNRSLHTLAFCCRCFFTLED
jgi:hypothetical protein